MLGTYEVFGRGDLLLVEAKSARCDELAKLSLGGEYGCLLREEVSDLDSRAQGITGDLELRHALEYGEERAFVEGL